MWEYLTEYPKGLKAINSKGMVLESILAIVNKQPSKVRTFVMFIKKEYPYFMNIFCKSSS